jgi:hypothetical protein
MPCNSFWTECAVSWDVSHVVWDTDMRRLTTGIRSEKCVVWRFRRCANVRVYLHKPRYYSTWYSLLLLGYKPVQHGTVLNTVGNCNTVVGNIILYYYNIIILRDHRRICGPSLTEMLLCGSWLLLFKWQLSLSPYIFSALTKQQTTQPHSFLTSL